MKDEKGLQITFLAEDTDEVITVVDFTESEADTLYAAAQSAGQSLEEFIVNALEESLDRYDADARQS